MTISSELAEAYLRMPEKAKLALLRSQSEDERWQTLGLLAEALGEEEVLEEAEEVLPLAA